MGALILCIFAAEPDPWTKYPSYVAYYYVHWGEADSFYQEYLNRIETIENSEADVVLTPYVNRPRILQASELSEFPCEGANSAMAQWYHKNSITCIKQDSE